MKKYELSKKHLGVIVAFIFVITIAFFMLGQFVMSYGISDFTSIDIDEIEEIKIVQKDSSVVTKENTYETREIDVERVEETKMIIDGLHEIRLKRDFSNELLHHLGQWVRFPDAAGSIEYRIHIKTRDEIIDIELVSGNTYMDLNVVDLNATRSKKHVVRKQYYFEIKDGFDEEFLKTKLESLVRKLD